MPDNDRYEPGTLIAAAIIFAGIAVVLYFMPNIMLAAGARSPWLAGAVIAVVLVLPFVGLWLRGRSRK